MVPINNCHRSGKKQHHLLWGGFRGFMNILLKDCFSWCCVSGAERHFYGKPGANQGRQWVSLPSASSVADSQSRAIIRAVRNFPAGCFFSWKPPWFPSCPAPWQAAWQAGGTGELRSPQSWVPGQVRQPLLPTCTLQGDPGHSRLVSPPKFLCLSEILNGKFCFLVIRCLF